MMRTTRLTRTLLMAAGLAVSVPLAGLAQSPELRAKHMRVMQLYATGHNVEAAAVARQALDLGVGEFGEEHPSTAALMINLARLHAELEEWTDAERLYRRAAAVRTKTLGGVHPETGDAHAGLGEALGRQARFEEAEASYWEALHALGHEAARDPHALNEVNLSARLYRAWALYFRGRRFVDEERFEEADMLYWSAITVFESNASVDRGVVVAALGERAAVLRALGREDEAVELDSHADAVSRGRASCPAGLFTVC